MTARPPLYLPYISLSPLYLPYISPNLHRVDDRAPSRVHADELKGLGEVGLEG